MKCKRCGTENISVTFDWDHAKLPFCYKCIRLTMIEWVIDQEEVNGMKGEG